MNRSFVLLSLLVALPASSQNVPGSVAFNARLTDSTGVPVAGTFPVVFSLYAAQTGGAAIWSETVPSVTFASDGSVFTALGTITPLSALTLDGRALFLEVTVDGTVLQPRLGLHSVPYAIRASVAASAGAIGGLTESSIQRRIVGSCPGNQAMRSVDAMGGVTCEPFPPPSPADITAVSTGSGLSGGGTSGDVTIALTTCAQNQILKSDGMAWACAADAVGPTLTATPPLAINSNTLSLSGCPPSQVLKSDGTTFLCADDLQGVQGSGAATQLALWGASNALSGSAGLVFAANSRLGVNNPNPSVALDVGGEVVSEGVKQVGFGAPTTYRVSTRRYVVEAPASVVGRLVPLDVQLTSSLCRDDDGCSVTLAMVNWDTAQPGNVFSRKDQLFGSQTNGWWRLSNDTSGLDGNGAVQEWLTGDCLFTDAETGTGTNNFRVDNALGFGLLNLAGGTYSDTLTGCRLIIED